MKSLPELKHDNAIQEMSEDQYRRRVNDAVPHVIRILHRDVDDHADDTPFALITFQKGPVAEVGRNGVFTEELLPEIVRFLQSVNAVVPSRETALAITKLQEALFWLNERTRIRREQKVEGTYKSHRS